MHHSNFLIWLSWGAEALVGLLCSPGDDRFLFFDVFVMRYVYSFLYFMKWSWTNISDDDKIIYTIHELMVSNWYALNVNEVFLIIFSLKFAEFLDVVRITKNIHDFKFYNSQFVLKFITVNSGYMNFLSWKNIPKIFLLDFFFDTAFSSNLIVHE